MFRFYHLNFFSHSNRLSESVVSVNIGLYRMPNDTESFNDKLELKMRNELLQF